MKERMPIGFMFKQINTIYEKDFNQLLKTIGITASQCAVLDYLFRSSEESVNQRDIEKEFRISRATATNTLQVMEKNGLIVRKSQDKDARLKRIVMTEPAYEQHAKVEEQMRLMDERMLQGMTETEVSQFYRLLGKMLSNLEQMESECGRQVNEKRD